MYDGGYMNSDEMDYKALRRTQQLEQNSPSFSKINKNFYQNLSKYIKYLEENLKKEENEQKMKLYKEEIQNTNKIAQSIYESREKKLVQAALSTVRGGKPDLKDILDIERKLFDRLVENITTVRENIFKRDKYQEEKSSQINTEPTDSLPSKNKNPIIQVTKTIPEFVGTDLKIYSLRKDDVLSINEEISQPLQKRSVVKQIK